MRRRPAELVDAAVVNIDGPWTHRMVAANGARFHVATLGEGPLVLLMHGFPQFWWTWRHQMRALADAGWRAAAMDLRGYGGSDKPPRGYDALTLAADAAGVVRALGERDAVVVGHGLGSAVAWTVATAHPEQARALAAVSMPHPRRLRHAYLTRPRDLRTSLLLASYQAPLLPERRLTADGGLEVLRLLHLWSGGRAESISRAESTEITPWLDGAAAALYCQAMCIPGVAHCAMESYRWAVRSLLRHDGLRYARRMRDLVAVPTLHLHGAADPMVPAAACVGSEEYVDAAYSFHTVPGAGHFPHEECPDEVTRLLLDWLSEHDPARRSG